MSEEIGTLEVVFYSVVRSSGEGPATWGMVFDEEAIPRFDEPGSPFRVAAHHRSHVKVYEARITKADADRRMRSRLGPGVVAVHELNQPSWTAGDRPTGYALLKTAMVAEDGRVVAAAKYLRSGNVRVRDVPASDYSQRAYKVRPELEATLL